ncbi:MAG: hypothetical protein H7070_16145 [Saprospiraceae bacterium]|nr:hypothetical protein [Pyrinomonadaceae bacterium]
MSRIFLRTLTGVLFAIWFGLVLYGKGGFVHILLLNAITIGVVEIACTYRSKVKVTP